MARRHPSDLLGAARLAADAIWGLAGAVEMLHLAVQRASLVVGAPVEGSTRGITGLVYRSVRGATRLVDRAARARASLVPAAGTARSSARREAVLAALNGVVGDHLAATGNPLAITMCLRSNGRPLDLRASMGGLVARSAFHHGEAAGHRWPRLLRHLVFLGTPHHGAPLERGGNLLASILELSPYAAPFARIGRLRSAGVTDLRFGNLLDEDWQDRDRFALRTRPEQRGRRSSLVCERRQTPCQLAGTDCCRLPEGWDPAVAEAFPRLRIGGTSPCPVHAHPFPQPWSRSRGATCLSYDSISTNARTRVRSCPVGGPTWNEPSRLMLGTPLRWKWSRWISWWTPANEQPTYP